MVDTFGVLKLEMSTDLSDVHAKNMFFISSTLPVSKLERSMFVRDWHELKRYFMFSALDVLKPERLIDVRAEQSANMLIISLILSASQLDKSMLVTFESPQKRYLHPSGIMTLPVVLMLLIMSLYSVQGHELTLAPLPSPIDITPLLSIVHLHVPHVPLIVSAFADSGLIKAIIKKTARSNINIKFDL